MTTILRFILFEPVGKIGQVAHQKQGKATMKKRRRFTEPPPIRWTPRTKEKESDHYSKSEYGASYLNKSTFRSGSTLNMVRKIHNFTVSSKEADHLRALVSEDEKLLNKIQIPKPSSEGRLTLDLELEAAEELRACLTEQLAKIGFKEDYSLTEEGELIEALIEKFYISNRLSHNLHQL